MKKVSIIISLLFISTLSYTQDVDKYLAEAKTAYSQKNLEDTRFALQQSLQELDVAISKEILEILPTELEGLSADVSTDEYMGSSMGYVGVFVNRDYGTPGESPNVEVDLMNDSPFLTMVTGFLANPMMSMAVEGQKSVKVEGYKSVLQEDKDENDVLTGYTLQIPFGSSLLTMKANGITDESIVLKMGHSLNVREIAELVE